MASSPSLKELSKAISNYLPSAALPLPPDLYDLIEAYIQKHESCDGATADRVQDELLLIYQKLVHDQPTRHAPFIALLRQLRIVLKDDSRVQQWWDRLLEPVLSHLNHDKTLAAEAFGVVFDVLTDDTDSPPAPSSPASHNPLADSVISIWMREFDKVRTDLASTGSQKEKQIRQTLLQYGKKKPRDFLHAVNGFFVREETRYRALELLCDFVQSQPPHLHQVLHTPLFENMLRCLQQDTSTTVINMTMTALIMFLPYMPSSLVPHLPVLFNIYARLLFWDRELGPFLDVPERSEEVSIASSASWERCTFSSARDGATIPHLINYFTILYGLYPHNFMDYVRKPQRYLRHANSNADEVEVQSTEIRQKSERFRECHRLHPNFYSLTIESEKTDFGRWIKSEPPEVLADCMALCLTSEADRRHNFEALPLSAGGAMSRAESEWSGIGSQKNMMLSSERNSTERAALLAGSGSILRDASPLDIPRENWRLTQSSDSPVGSRVQSALMRRYSQSSHPSTRDSLEVKGRDLGGDSPTLPAHLTMSTGSTSQPHIQEMITSNKVIKSGLHQSLANDSVPSLALSYHDSIPEKQDVQPTTSSKAMASSPITSADPNVQISQLYHQVLLLNNDLNFERYLKQQHMAHIGELRRRQVRELATEAETQNLLNSNRLLKKGLEDSRKMERQVKKDGERGRALGKKLEGDLTAKLRNFREEQKKWAAERGELRRELDTLREERDTFKRLVMEADLRDVGARQDMQSADMMGEQMSRLKKEVEGLTISVRDHEAKEMERQIALRAATAAESKVEQMNLMIKAMETELEQMRGSYESELVGLNTKVHEAQRQQDQPQGQSASVSAMIESALAASHAREADMEKQHHALLKKHSALQTKYLEVRSPGRPGVDLGVVSATGFSDSDAEASVVLAGPSGSRTRIQRGFSEPEAFEGVAYNVTPPLDIVAEGGSPSPGDGSKMSPERDRYYGRGGVQNALRKDKKDKKDDGDKKSTGIRGIRRFVQ